MEYRDFEFQKSQSNDLTNLYLWLPILALIGLGMDWLAQCQDNVTEWNIGSWCQWASLPVRQHGEVTVTRQYPS